MAAPILELTAPSRSSYTPSLAGVIPAGTTAGKRLIAIVLSDAAPVFDAVADWVLEDSIAYSANVKLFVYSKTAVGSDAAPAFTLPSGNEAMIALICRVDAYSALNIVTAALAGTAIAIPDGGEAPGDSLVLRVAGYSSGAPNGLTIDGSTPNVYSDNSTVDSSSNVWLGVTQESVLQGAAIGTATAETTVSEQAALATIVLSSAAVNQAPVFDTPIPDQSIVAGTTGSYDAGAHVTDPEGDAVTYSVSPALPSGVTLNANTGVVTWDGSQVATATTLFTITADDGQSNATDDTFNLEVLPPVLVVDSISDTTPDVGSQITIDTSNALAPLNTGDFNLVSESNGSAVVDIPNPTTFILTGQTFPTLPFLADVAIPVSDGTNTADAVIQIPPETGYAYTEIADLHADGAYPDIPGSAIGQWIYTTVLSGDVVFDPADGRGSAGPAGGSVSYRIYNGEWGSVGTIDYPAFSSDEVSIDSVTPARNGVTATFSYPNVDVTSFEYSIDGSTWLAASSPLTIAGLSEETAYTLQIRPVLDGSPGSATSSAFTTLPAIDSTPDAISFNAQLDVARSVFAVSEAITVANVDAGIDIPVSVIDGEYSVSTDGGFNWGDWTSTATNVRLNYQIRVRHTTSATYNATTTTTLDLDNGNVTAGFESTTLADAVAPVISLVGGNTSIVQFEQWVEPGYSAIDNADGDISVSGVTVSGLVDTDTVGEYTLTYTATDAAGNVSTTTRIVTVTEFVQQDSLSPVISLVGGNVTVAEGGTYIEPGFSALDDTDGDITNSVSISGSVNTAVPGTYELTYSATDTAGNTGSVTRTVTVVAEVIYPVLVAAPSSRTYTAERTSRIEMGESNVFTKQPEEILDFDFDLSEWLARQDDALTSEGDITISTNSNDLMNVGYGIVPGTSRVKVWLSGGIHSDSEVYDVELKITTDGYRTAQFLIRIAVIDKVMP